MKRTFAKLLSLFVVLTLVIAMVPAVFAVDGTVSVTAGNTTLKVGDTTRVSVTDANGTAVPNVTLSSDHDDIVSVIDSSTIKALKVGSATITATVTAEDKTVQTLGSVQITVQSGVSAITADTSVFVEDRVEERHVAERRHEQGEEDVAPRLFVLGARNAQHEEPEENESRRRGAEIVHGAQQEDFAPFAE